ncbi:MAG TPA: DUF3147 family protein [Gaiellaceae bacterium]|nr:DUF3147 family protein [Gaiellaceae bacterium]
MSRVREYGIRFTAGAATSLAAALVGTFVGVREAGPLLAFPAIYLAGLTLVERREGERPARDVAGGAVLGAVGLAAYAAAADYTTTRLAWPAALAVALGAWLAVSFALYGVLCLVRRA